MSRSTSKTTDAPEWSLALRKHRERVGLSRSLLALRAGISEPAVKAFEWGTRRPKEATLAAIVDVLGLTREEANPIRLAMGHPDDWYAILHDRFRPDAVDLAAEVDLCPWPVYVTNQGIDVVYFNKPFQRVMRVDLSRDFLGHGERNLISQLGNPRFAELIANFDELVTFMIGMVKGDPRWGESPERPAPWLQTRVEMFLRGDASLVARVLDIWAKAPAIAHGARHTYGVRVHHESGGVMRFRGSTSIADLWSELTWQEWVPEDGATWALLDG